MKTWKSFLPEVLPEVVGCPDPMAVNAIRKAAIDFAEKTKIWTYDFPLVDIVASTATYTLTPLVGDQANVDTVLYLGYYATGTTKSRPVNGPFAEIELDELRPGWRDDLNTGTQNSPQFFKLDGNVIRLSPVPIVNQSGALFAHVSLKPTRASDSGPDIFYNDWLEWIAYGAKWKLMAIPRKPWSDAKMALYYLQLFNQGINRASAKVLKGGGMKSVMPYPRAFGR